MPFFKLKKKTSELAESRGMLLTDKSLFAVSEAYKTMRTNLMYIKAEGACKKLAFTSAMTGEGKSVNCANTAISLAQVGMRVLLIDADMRRPKLQRLFGKPLSPGLSEVLAGIGETASLHETSYENLMLLTAGRIPPNPAELLSSGWMGKVLERSAQNFDYILIDMPPLNMVTDAAVVADLVDGYLMVIRADTVPVDGIKDAVLTLEQVNGKIVGLLLNATPQSNKRYYRKGYYKNDYVNGV